MSLGIRLEGDQRLGDLGLAQEPGVFPVEEEPGLEHLVEGDVHQPSRLGALLVRGWVGHEAVRERDEEGSEIHRAAAVDVRLGVDVAEDVVVDVLHLELGARGEELGILDRAVLVRVDALEHHADVLERPEHRGEFHREGLQGLYGVDAGVSVAVLAELAREGQVEGLGGLGPEPEDMQAPMVRRSVEDEAR